jgi:hypothetical protein
MRKPVIIYKDMVSSKGRVLAVCHIVLCKGCISFKAGVLRNRKKMVDYAGWISELNQFAIHDTPPMHPAPSYVNPFHIRTTYVF